MSYFYPFPKLHDGRLYVKHSWAWLMGVRLSKEEKEWILEGVQTVRVPEKEALQIDGEPWFPLSRLAEASRAKVQVDERERWLDIEPEYRQEEW